VELSKRTPLNCAVSAVGSPPHLACIQMQQATGAQWQYVPYKGGSQAITDTISGQTQVLMNGLAATLPHVLNGRLKAIAVSHRSRMPLVSQIPTISESGEKIGAGGFESGSWQGVMVSAAVPSAVVAQINAAVISAIRSPEVRARVLGQGAQVTTQTSAEMNTFFATERKRWEVVATRNNVRVE